MNIGCHLGGSKQEFVDNFNQYVDMGINTFQIFTSSPQKVDFKLPAPNHEEVLKKNYVIHSPFWVSFFNPKVANLMIKNVHHLRDHWCKSGNRRVNYVTHCQSTKGDHSKMMRDIHHLLNKLAYAAGDKIRICLENTAGYKSSLSPLVKDLVEIKRYFNSDRVGICVDSEHAFAAGEHPNDLPYELADVIHLNSIPPYVKFGGHLDRHSFTPLRQSKIGLDYVKKVLKEVRSEVPIILERSDNKVISDDILLLKELRSDLWCASESSLSESSIRDLNEEMENGDFRE